MLERVSAILADTFEVVARATDGRSALDMASRLDPDAIVLDINMPDFDGFETMRALALKRSRVSVEGVAKVERSFETDV